MREEKAGIKFLLIIATKEIFKNYATWLFNVLEVYEKLLLENAQKIPPRHF